MTMPCMVNSRLYVSADAERALRDDQVVADQCRGRAAEKEEDGDRSHVEDGDPLVVGGQQPASQRIAVLR